jgi:hypothetical protein
VVAKFVRYKISRAKLSKLQRLVCPSSVGVMMVTEVLMGLPPLQTEATWELRDLAEVNNGHLNSCGKDINISSHEECTHLADRSHQTIPT